MANSLQNILALLSAGVALAGCASDALPRQEVSAVFAMDETRPAAPYGGEVSSDIANYTRVAPNVALAGRLEGNGVREAQTLGFSLIIDLRQPDEEGVADELKAAQALGMNYRNIPLSSDESASEDVAAIAPLLNDDTNYPVLIHCASANRAGAFWALYRARAGVDPITAIEEGRAGGMRSREKLVRALLGLSPTTETKPETQ